MGAGSEADECSSGGARLLFSCFKNRKISLQNDKEILPKGRFLYHHAKREKHEKRQFVVGAIEKYTEIA